jgi:hypothetical protein
MAISSGQASAGSGAVNDIFGGIGLLYKAKGSRLEAAMYDKAAVLARLNKQFSATSTDIKESQQQRDIYKSIGGTQSDVAGAGFAATGSALDILRESASQGALTKAVISQQGLIEEAGYQQQAESYDIMAKASRLAAKADTIGAIGKFVGSGVSMAAAVAMSDVRLKRDIEPLGKLGSLVFYRYRYLWGDTRFIGVMAQDVLAVFPHAVLRGADGFLRVDYSKLVIHA